MLPRLNADASAKVEVQQTEFSHDLFGRYVCSTWEEVANNGGAPFDAVVIGAGMFGGACAEKLYRFGESINLRILVLEAGAFLASTHIQNLPHIGLGAPGGVPVPTNTNDPGPRNIVWGNPWHSNQSFPGLAYCPGGRSLFWGGWAPRLTDADLANWPPAVAAYLRANYGSEDDALWTAMEQHALEIAGAIAKHPANIQYWYGGNWNAKPPPPGSTKDKIGTTHHESGTLWMGDGAAVADVDGRFQHVDNAYVAGPALFPTCGSANPSLTGLVLARKTAQAIVRRLQPRPSEDFRPLLTGELAGWQMAGSSGFVVKNEVVESQGGIGLLWYTREQFKDFLLKVDWRATRPDDNSGVFIRFPALNSSNPQSDWQLAVNHGYEVQIDDTGFNPETGQLHDPKHETGAIYALAPAKKLASRPVGEWNTFEIEAKGDTITVVLNGEQVTRYKVDPLRPPAGHIGLQNHHVGSQVQFRNMLIKSL